MKLSEAKHIVGKMFAWAMAHKGVEVETEIIEESLEDLLKANTIVSKWNERRLAKQREKGGSISSLQMTINPRMIAALYTAIHYAPHNADNAESVIQYKNRFVFVINNKDEQ